ncbi:hypothetical protein PAMA_003947 [Pampus argenteus]
MGRANVRVVDLPIKIGGEAPEAVYFYGWGTGWSSGAMEVKLSAAVATHSIPLQYVHMPSFLYGLQRRMSGIQDQEVTGPLSPAVLVLTFMRHVGGGLLELTNERAKAAKQVAQPDTAIQRPRWTVVEGEAPEFREREEQPSPESSGFSPDVDAARHTYDIKNGSLPDSCVRSLSPAPIPTNPYPTPACVSIHWPSSLGLLDKPYSSPFV